MLSFSIRVAAIGSRTAQHNLHCLRLPKPKRIQLSGRTTLLVMGQRFSSGGVSPVDPKNQYRLVVVGGGSGGISVAARLAKKLEKGSIAVIEPSSVHYYQPLWTLVGGGQKSVEDSAKPTGEVIPPGVDWIKDKCAELDPKNNKIKTASGEEAIKYDYLVVAAGIQIDWDKIDGLVDALKNDPAVCSNYSPEYVKKTFPAIQALKEGDKAVFTFPNTPVKCAGAPQKIMYLADAFLRQKGIRSGITIDYNTSLPAVFGIKKYAEALNKVCSSRDLNVNTRMNLVKVDWQNKTAFFQNLDQPDSKPVPFKYNLLHVCPPMSAPKFLSPLAKENTNGFVAVNPQTLQHVDYKNVFAIGDCSSAPTAKTAAAVACQNRILAENLLAQMQADETRESNTAFPGSYNGYTSCPLVTGNNKCILAEFDYTGQPRETFPFNQAVERRTMFWLKRDFFPFVYWNFMLKGNWSGPETFKFFGSTPSSGSTK